MLNLTSRFTAAALTFAALSLLTPPPLECGAAEARGSCKHACASAASREHRAAATCAAEHSRTECGMARMSVPMDCGLCDMGGDTSTLRARTLRVEIFLPIAPRPPLPLFEPRAMCSTS